MKLNKKILIISIFLIIFILITFFMKNNYKKTITGNNIIGNSKEEISNNILNINSYKASIEVTIISNKNENKYILNQEYKKSDYAKQIVVEPSNIQGLVISNQGNTLKLENSKLELTKIYDNYEYLPNNNLFLNTFIENFNKEEDSKISEKEDEVIMSLKLKDNNKYTVYETLTIDKKTNKPNKLEIKDINKKTLIYILYKEIEVNK